MSTTEIAERPISWKIKVMHVARIIIATIARVFYRLYYGNEGEKIPPITDDVLKEPAVEVAKKIRNKEITSVEVLEACIRRIKDVNPILNCFIEDRFELALQEAKQVDEVIRSGSKSSEDIAKEKPFLGVPFTTKDCIGVKGLHLTSGVFLRKDVIADEDATVIKLLKEKGAIIIGLTNVPEVCMWWESNNRIYGRAKNPYNTTRIPGGSSGGEGSLQAAAGSCFGIGTDIAGSIRIPAFFNGIFGHKPSKFLVSNDGIHPKAGSDLHNSFLVIGPMTRHAVDLKPILKIISGKNARKLNLDVPVDIKKIKFFYQFSNDAPVVDAVDPDIIAAMQKVVEYLKVRHKIYAEEKKVKQLQKSGAMWIGNMRSTSLFGELILKKDTVGVILFEMLKSLFGISNNTFIALFTALIDHGGLSFGDARYKHYLKFRENLENIFTNMLGNNGVFLFPTQPIPAPYHNETFFKPFNLIYTGVVNCLGLPATTIPLGFSRDGLPIGLQVVANHNQDRLCLAVAEELEKAFGGWVEPQKM